LGRYWDKGPQQRIFLPGVWLKKGENEIIVLELLLDNGRFIKGEHGLMVGDEAVEEGFLEKNNKERLLDLFIAHQVKKEE
jgi:hypothetical protein